MNWGGAPAERNDRTEAHGPDVIRTTSADPAFRVLVRELDRYLAVHNGDADAFFAQFNSVDHIQHVIVVHAGAVPVGCGAFKAFGHGTVEVKRMFTSPDHRNRGIASMVLKALEEWARELGYRRCVLETGALLHDATALYRKHGYTIIPNYGPYAGVESSVCFEKLL